MTTHAIEIRGCEGTCPTFGPTIHVLRAGRTFYYGTDIALAVRTYRKYGGTSEKEIDLAISEAEQFAQSR